MIPEGYTLLASCFDVLSEPEREGGIFALQYGVFIRLTGRSTAGMAFDGERLAIAGRAENRNDRPSTLTIYKSNAEPLEFFVPYANLHGVTWHDGQVVVVSTVDNCVIWVNPENGEVTRVWAPNDVRDSWHINDVVLHNERLYVTAFGRFDTEQGWRLSGIGIMDRGSPPPDPPTGMLFDLETGEDVISELGTPHTPTPINEGHPLRKARWAVCESLEGSLTLFDIDGFKVRTIPVDTWSRGLAFTEDTVFVGASRRLDIPKESSKATVVEFNRLSWAEERRYEIPARHLYSLLLVPESVVNLLG